MKTYVKIDDDLPFNRKVRKVTAAARWLYVASICYAGHNKTSGDVERSALTMLDGTRKLATELEAAGLWESTADGWHIHDYERHNRTREQIEDISARNREAGAKGLAKRWQDASETDSEMPSKSIANRWQARSDTMFSVSSQDDPSPEDPDSTEGTDSEMHSTSLRAPRRRSITEDVLRGLQDEFPHVNVRAVAENYLNWSGNSKHVDKVLGLRNQLKIPGIIERFSQAPNGAKPKPEISDPRTWGDVQTHSEEPAWLRGAK